MDAIECTETYTIRLPQGFEKGQVFTPTFLANWVAELISEYLGEDWSGKIIDPACGDGELLDAAIAKLPNSKLYGVDIDASATQSARLRLCRSATINTDDMLISPLVGKSGKPLTFGALISNPPWGADLLHSRASLKKLGYSLANGQFDSWSLFVEASLNLLDKGGVAAFILPDAIFAPEHTATRALIAENFSIELIARLGEGIFRGVYRGATVLVVRKRKPQVNHLVEVFRLAKSERAAVMSGCLDLQEARMRDRHFVPQGRFVSDTRARWDIDVRSSDQKVLERMESEAGNWSELILSGRGVELSKKGLVKACRNCGHATPAPTRPRDVTCAGCGRTAHSDEMLTEQIVVSEPDCISGFMPLIVGEDIGRYDLSCSRQIKLDVPGINYKDQKIYGQERLLVRKTGIGLKATVTKKVAASNQVVFHYVPRSKDLSFFLYYVLGVLSSRTMFAYHLRKSGENEWRSHPYVTPKSLAALPIPAPEVGTQAWRQAVEIANRVRKHLRYQGRSKTLDLEIEGLVAGLYGLGQPDLGWVKKVICDAQNLEPMRALGEFDPCSISIVMVS
ncbi:N-6 DNA methylase [Ruegeria faecimaris]|uniref:N-6 DNA methylase n=1 Tax=Ruegeria faecimaris TaxID=686389 RepID=UPI002330F554|nr:N-6 DNA methylase [Ruegeria faecimaris]